MRVADDLKPHNRETIEKILDFYKTERKCCAIQATGTGKTFLILRLLEIFNDEGKVAVIFAPNNEIIKQTKKRMKKFGLNNATFYTYQKLSIMTDEEISAIEVDLIVCDELHRTGAKTWGQKFEALVDSHLDSKVFGVTATPLRCADGRDMAVEYFDGNKACNISLAEALVREIIPVMPLYVSALYTFEEEYQKMSDKIDKAKNSSEEKVELQRELLAAKKQLEKANGVPEIIKKYITNYNGKYLVFCKDKKHLYAMKDVVVGWFREAGYDGRIFEYPYYSDSSAVKKNLENFENNKEEGLKLLFIIDKLNEGLHLDEVHGCILLRTTVSNIIYYQQIGRAIDAGSREQRVILDLVSNFNSLKSFNLKKELEEKVKERKNGRFSDCSEEFELDKFDVVDLVQPCIDVFNNIDKNIYGVIEATIKEFKKYIDIYKTPIIPKTKDFSELRSLCKIVRSYYKQGTLSDKYFKILDDMHFIWNTFDEIFQLRFVLLQEYINDTGDYAIKSTIKYKGFYLGKWVRQLRSDRETGLLDNKKIKLLDNINFYWKYHEAVFDYNLSILEECIERKIKLNDKTVYKNVNIGNWLFITQRTLYRKGKLEEEKYLALKKCGVDLKEFLKKKFLIIDIVSGDSVATYKTLQEMSDDSQNVFGKQLSYSQIRHILERKNSKIGNLEIKKIA